MEQIKENKIREKVRYAIKDFVEKFEDRYLKELNDPTGVINAKKNNAFVGRELRLANADAKFTLNQNSKRKSTGVLYANKTRREV